MRMAIVHEWISARAGSELVFEALAQTFPAADLYALSVSPGVSMDVGGRRIRTSVLDSISPIRERRALLLPMMPLAWNAFRRPTYDLVISSTHAFAREFVRRDELHLSYIHAPMRYAWTRELDPRWRAPRVIATPAEKLLRARDLKTVAGVRSFAANSKETSSRVKQFYSRESSVIYPPVEIDDLLSIVPRRQGYALALGRWVAYKRFDLAIEACRLAHLRLVVAGGGPEESRLRAMVDESTYQGAQVTFVSRPTRSQVRELLGGASLFIFPGREDFGIVNVEAQAAGVPVVGLGAGGALETVLDGVTGALAAEQTSSSLAEAIARALSLEIDPDVCRQHALQFGPDQFRNEVRKWVTSHAGPT